jgi:hypothetical protein
MKNMSVDEKVACAVNAIVGGILGGAIFFGGFAGFDLLIGASTAWWNGWIGLVCCVVAGAAVGVVSYFQRHEEAGFNFVGIYSGASGGWLFARRIGVLISGVVAFYFLWQLARGI